MLRFCITIEGDVTELGRLSRLVGIARAVEAALQAPVAALAASELELEPEPAPPRQNGQTEAQKAALEAYRASLPPKQPKPEPPPRRSVRLDVPLPAPAIVDAPPTKEKPGRELWDQIKDDAPALAWHVELAKKRGWPPLILRWSAGMVREARAAADAALPVG
jgi:hypothetical protein